MAATASESARAVSWPPRAASAPPVRRVGSSVFNTWRARGMAAAADTAAPRCARPPTAFQLTLPRPHPDQLRNGTGARPRRPDQLAAVTQTANHVPPAASAATPTRNHRATQGETKPHSTPELDKARLDRGRRRFGAKSRSIAAGSPQHRRTPRPAARPPRSAAGAGRVRAEKRRYAAEVSSMPRIDQPMTESPNPPASYCGVNPEALQQLPAGAPSLGKDMIRAPRYRADRSQHGIQQRPPAASGSPSTSAKHEHRKIALGVRNAKPPNRSATKRSATNPRTGPEVRFEPC